MIITSVKLKTYLLKKYLFPTEGLIGRQRVGKQFGSGPGSQCRSLLRNQYWFLSIRGERMARYTMELGGKSAAIVLDDMETDEAVQSLTGSLCMLSGQVCSIGLDGPVLRPHRPVPSHALLAPAFRAWALLAWALFLCVSPGLQENAGRFAQVQAHRLPGTLEVASQRSVLQGPMLTQQIATGFGQRQREPPIAFALVVELPAYLEER